MREREFDRLSGSYEELLRDPIRDRFSGGGSHFFHLRKRDLILDYFARRNLQTNTLKHLDLGCGKGDLLTMLKPAFAYSAGCDPSSQMMRAVSGIEVRLQDDASRIPFDSGQFDFVTAVCVYHHVPPPARAALTREVTRVLAPGGVFAIIEHNPFNPLTRLIVSRTPVDADAVLLKPGESRSLLENAEFAVRELRYFLYLPGSLYHVGKQIETVLAGVPLGGQYAAFGQIK